MVPRIGITCGTAGVPVAEGVLPSHYVGLGYPRSVSVGGGLPLLIPAVAGREADIAAAVIGELDGLVLAGGTDIHPETYGGHFDDTRTHEPDRARDLLEIELVRLARERGLPILGICRGFQMLNVAYGGTLDQHRPHQVAALADVPGLRVQVTPVQLERGSRAAAVLGREKADVYCLHHQAVDELGAGLRVSGQARDGLVEAIEDPSAAFVLGLLWHPEQMVDHDSALLPYEALVRAARERAA